MGLLSGYVCIFYYLPCFIWQGTPLIAIPNPFEMFTWTAQKKQKAVDKEQDAIKPLVEIETSASNKVFHLSFNISQFLQTFFEIRIVHFMGTFFFKKYD